MTTVGILGGGQLARMMVLAGAPLGLRFVVFDPAADACAGQLAPLQVGAFDDTAALARLAERNMQLQCNVQEGQAWMGNGGRDATLTPERLHPSL